MATATTTPSKKRYDVDVLKKHNHRHQFSRNFYECLIREVRPRCHYYLDSVFDDQWPVKTRRLSYKHLLAEKEFYRSLLGLMSQCDRALPLP